MGDLSTGRQDNAYGKQAKMMKSERFVRPLLVNGRFSRTFCASDRYSENRGSFSANLQGHHGTAYQILGVPSTCSQECIRQAFRKLAKLTHPDMQSGSSSSSDQFVLILSAYQILSDPKTRAQYDAQLQAWSREKSTADSITIEMNTDISSCDDLEVVEWLRWYRKRMMTLVHQQEIGTGSYFQNESRNLQEALKGAYFGPQIEDDILPDCFEAEERGNNSESEILHLVSGRYFIGAVMQANQPGVLDVGTKVSMSISDSKISEQSHMCFSHKKNLSGKVSMLHQNRDLDLTELEESEPGHSAFVDLELYLYGNLVARATRSHCKKNDGTESELNVDGMDEIKIYLCNNADEDNSRNSEGVLVGRILGLNTTESGEKGKVYSPNGEHTHFIWQFRTPWVKHMHWFKIDDKQMLCECKSTRARLPSSKYWLFEPRSRNHNIGGWYIEMLWRNKERQNPWANHLGLLHPAVYIFGTAYKTLDAESLQRRRRSLWLELFKERELIATISRVIRWCMTRLPSK